MHGRGLGSINVGPALKAKEEVDGATPTKSML
jgi:hypothetical protein